jgi:hypothetical protein
MSKTDLHFEPADYAPVAARITLFFERYPRGRIITELVSRSDKEITFKATVYRSEELDVAAGTGWASERIGDGEVNEVACLENTETSAIGRALANIGYTASRQRPSAEEMRKASRERTRLARARAATASEAPARPPGRTATARRARMVRESSRAYEAAVDSRADVLADLRDLLDIAEREGMRPARVQALRSDLEGGAFDDSALEHLERALRRWLVRQAARQRATDRPTAEGDTPGPEPA